MRKTLSLLGWVVAGVLLVLNPRTGLVPASSAATIPASSNAGAVSPTAPPSSSAGSGPPTQSAGSSDQVTAVGDAESTRFGLFQVEITVDNGKLAGVAVLQHPTDRRSTSINNRAFPAYEQLAIQAQGTGFNALSGATITWRAYTASLQSALDAVGL